MIHIAAPIIETEEIEAVQSVLTSGVLAQGPWVARLEEAFAAYCGTTYAVAVNSGTAAIHAALFAAGIGPGDEVITTPFSFIATINPILFVGAKPVLVDIDPETFNMDAARLEQAITPKTKAILPVHLYGQPCNMQQIGRLAKKHGLLVIEDACQAVAAEYEGRKVGNLGDIACFSLYATKNIMSGEGGVATTNNEAYAQAMKRFRQHGMTAPYEYAHIGLNYRMSDLHGSIAVAQLQKADRFTKQRQHNAQLLDKGLTGIKGLTLPYRASDRTHVFHQYTVRITGDFPMTRDELVVHLRDKAIIAGLYYPKPLHFYDHIAAGGYNPGDFPVAEQASRQVLSLPVHPKLNEADIRHITQTISSIKA
ncbi:MAG TPA: DegT/DnrJ/EryC1/StrS family aminotransferase [Nevskiaceae bacterium]|nr:DegT/DnrJ/EryC1/StrS family aminotransferase [Nevskiaceae bacterium]